MALMNKHGQTRTAEGASDIASSVSETHDLTTADYLVEARNVDTLLCCLSEVDVRLLPTPPYVL